MAVEAVGQLAGWTVGMEESERSTVTGEQSATSDGREKADKYRTAGRGA